MTRIQIHQSILPSGLKVQFNGSDAKLDPGELTGVYYTPKPGETISHLFQKTVAQVQPDAALYSPDGSFSAQEQAFESTLRNSHVLRTGTQTYLAGIEYLLTPAILEGLVATSQDNARSLNQLEQWLAPQIRPDSVTMPIDTELQPLQPPLPEQSPIQNEIEGIRQTIRGKLYRNFRKFAE